MRQPERGRSRRPNRSAKKFENSLKLVLDGSLKSSIESKASLNTNQLLNVSLKRAVWKSISRQRNEAKKLTA